MSAVIIREKNGRVKSMCKQRQRLELFNYKPRDVKDVRSHQKLGDSHGTDSLSASSEGTNTTDILISSIWPPEP